MAVWFVNDTCYTTDCCLATLSNVATLMSSNCKIDGLMLEGHDWRASRQTTMLHMSYIHHCRDVLPPDNYRADISDTNQTVTGWVDFENVVSMTFKGTLPCRFVVHRLNARGKKPADFTTPV